MVGKKQGCQAIEIFNLINQMMCRLINQINSTSILAEKLSPQKIIIKNVRWEKH